MMLFVLALAAVPPLENLDALDRDVAAVARSIGRTSVGVDRRLRLAQCPQAVEIAAGEPQSLSVRCPDVGWRLRIPLVPSVTASASMPMVRRGDPLTVRTVGDGFTIEAEATAAEDGALGATVRARMSDGKQMISGIVSGPREIGVGSLNLPGGASLPRIAEEEIR